MSSVPRPSSVNPIVGGTAVLSASQYSNFASNREAQLAKFQMAELKETDNHSENNGNNVASVSTEKDGIYSVKKLPPMLRNLVEDTQHYKPYYTKSYFTKTDNDVSVYSSGGGIPAPPNKDYTYYKTVITPDDKMLYIYKHDKTGKLIEYHFETPKNCNTKCPTHFSPVCGTNGVTYNNSCELNNARCKSGGMIDFQNAGYCQNGFNSKQYIDYKGNGYNIVDTNYTTQNGVHYVYVVDENLNTSIKKVIR